jgi:hypothetical protein
MISVAAILVRIWSRMSRDLSHLQPIVKDNSRMELT